jgi:hypothetical protein
MGVLNLPLQLTMSCSMLFVVQGSSVPKWFQTSLSTSTHCSVM